MTVYILKHKNKDFSGMFFSVEFYKGRGSTSSTFDRKRCIDAGCKDITQQYQASKAAQNKKAEAAAAKKEKEAAKKKAESGKEKEKVEEKKEEKTEGEETPATAEKE